MSTYLVTGGTGFIGRNVVTRLIAADPEATVFLLVRDGSLGRFERLIAELGPAAAPKVVPVPGDVELEGLGIAPEELPERVDHIVHLAAVYDMDAPEEHQRAANVDGTRHAAELALRYGATLHHVSSAAVAGSYEGTFGERDFDVAQDFPSAYHRTKFEAEKLVRETPGLKWQVYRPSVVVGDSVTGEIDKVDGPYYFFPILSWMSSLPRRLRLPFANLGYTNIVPVDFVAAALVALITGPEAHGEVFHLLNPQPQAMTELYNAVAPAFGGPKTVALPGGLIGELATRVGRRGEVRLFRDAAARQLGIPPSVLDYPFFKTTFTAERTLPKLRALGVELPPLRRYGPALFRYWEEHLDPGRNRRDDPRGPLVGKHVLITGGSSGIGREAAKQCVAQGATVFVLARKPDELAEAASGIEAEAAAPGIPKGRVWAYPCDVTDPEAVRQTVRAILAEHDHVDVLVNNAGRSIRRATINSVDRAHDYQRTMAVNYFGAVYLILELLPHMIARKSGHVVNVSSIGVQVRGPRFAAYVASKSALEAFSDVTAAETMSDHVTFTNIHMPLTRTRMIEPTTAYDNVTALRVEKAAGIVLRAIVERPRRIDSPLGTITQLGQFLSPRLTAAAQHQGYLLFPESAAALGIDDEDEPGFDGMTRRSRLARLAATRDRAQAMTHPLLGLAEETGLTKLARKAANRFPGINF
ncbi:SDR family oxidoreductase [Tsukamurella sp. 8F]|uniref:SDR family oxidoreductase n=1 Tax=unclassified Tsukamurella TaxID=2633480 RepID=UPI0023B896AB|nr:MULTISPECIES: SDR family oxidoreductase [unclassified Tsukamurella]MDF0529080.1 SDR family oxidoreductase [Tsukamurella sp. 8J]MDF0587454.1 SDR family oxidoreductase [Tsukamurella sp. 8F]